MFKFVVLFALAAASSAHYIPSGYHFVSYHPVSYVKNENKIETPKAEAESSKVEIKPDWDHKEWKNEEPEKPANYDFKYEVHDEKTGDIKRQSETASNGAVKGQYSLIDSDGFRRVVEYTADDIHGFQATVKREPTHIKIPQPAPKQEEPKAEEPKMTHWW